MEKIISFYGRVNADGVLEGIPKKKLTNELLQFKGKGVELIIKRRKRSRTHQQNKLYWVYCTIIGDELGYTKDEIHSILKYKFLKEQKTDENTGLVFDFIGSTAQLGVEQFMNYIESIFKFCAEELNIILPEPNSQLSLL